MSETSPPTDKVVYGLKMPSVGNNGSNSTSQDYLFLLKFVVINDGIENSDVSFTVNLNPSAERKSSSPPEPPPTEVYNFDDGNTAMVSFSYLEYFVTGEITIKTFSSPIGQFDKNLKNFFLDLKYGPNPSEIHDIEGFFELEMLT